MSSSTFSFRPFSFRPEWKVIAFVLAALVACETLLRVADDFISLDIRHIHAIPAISKKFVREDGLSILFMGNSMIRTDVNEAVFLKAEAEQLGPEPQVRIARVHLDASHLPEWYYTFKYSFVDEGSVPDVLVLGVAGDELADQSEVLTRQLAAFHAEASAVPEIFRHDVLTFPDRADFALAYVSVSYAIRERVSMRALSLLVPQYEDVAKALHDVAWEQQKRAAVHRQRTYHRLGRLAELAKSHSVDVIVVGMPLAPYNTDELEPELPCRIQAMAMTFVDAREIDGIHAGMYVDEMHLDAKGAVLFSKALAKRLAKPIRRIAIANEAGDSHARLYHRY
ncbi:MAG: hypothetical protein WD733_09080 [Bryobacterales bacterium]